MALYLFQGAMGKQYLIRLLPGLAFCVLLVGAWWLGYELPKFVSQGSYAGTMSLWVAAAFSRIKRA